MTVAKWKTWATSWLFVASGKEEKDLMAEVGRVAGAKECLFQHVGNDGKVP